MNEFYLIGNILSSGKNGFVKIELVPGFNADLKSIKQIFLDFWSQKKLFEIEEVLNTKSSVFIKFQNFDTDREISLLIGREIFISQNDLNSLKLFTPFKGSFIDYKIFRDQKLLGTVTDFFEAPSNPVIEITDENGKEILIPFVQEYFEKIDSDKKELVLKSDFGIYDDEN